MGTDDASFNQLNDALLAQESEEEPRRGTKDDVIAKIIKLHEEQGVELPHSNTKLRRMTKKELLTLLGHMLTDATRQGMARQVGADPETATDATIALGARMVHDLCASATERIGNPILNGYGYTIEGFGAALRDPVVREATDACLLEIAQDSDVLAYIESPWSRLGLAWMGAVASVARGVPRNMGNNHQRKHGARERRVRFDATPMGPSAVDEKDPV